MDDRTTPSSLGDRIRVAREAARMSQLALAKALGVARSSLTKWEAGQRTPDAKVVADMCRVLRVSPSLLLGLESEDHEDTVHLRMACLIQAEGREVARTLLGIGDLALTSALEGRLQIPISRVDLLAKTYRVSAWWLRSGDPHAWVPSLDSGVAVRLRFLRISSGVPPLDTYTATVEASEESVQEMLAAGWDIETYLKILIAVTPVKKPMRDQPYDLSWVLRGGPLLRDGIQSATLPNANDPECAND